MSCSLGGHWAVCVLYAAVCSSRSRSYCSCCVCPLYTFPYLYLYHVLLLNATTLLSFFLLFLMKMWCYGLLAGCKRAYLVPCYNSSIIYYHLQPLFLLDQTALNVSIVMLSLLDVNFTQMYHINLFIIRPVLLLCGSGKGWRQHNYTDHRAWKWNFI